MIVAAWRLHCSCDRPASAVARALREIGLLLELKGENRFRARAYETGARARRGAARGARRARRREAADRRCPGSGRRWRRRSPRSGRRGNRSSSRSCARELPPGAVELAEVPGLSLKKIQQLWTALGIDSVASLKRACADGRLATIKGFGDKTRAEARSTASIAGSGATSACAWSTRSTRPSRSAAYLARPPARAARSSWPARCGAGARR